MHFEEIYKLYKNVVYNLSLHYSQNAEDAEEITQDVFLAIHEKLESFKNNAQLKTWIYRIAVNKSLDFLKAKKRKKRWALFSVKPIKEQKPQNPLSNFNHPGVDLEQKEAVAHIFKAINQLPINQKNALILLKIENMSIKDTAEVLKMSEKGIESLFQRAKQNLEKLLKSTEGK